jgi:polysaccharide export outer membrane protein
MSNLSTRLLMLLFTTLAGTAAAQSPPPQVSPPKSAQGDHTAVMGGVKITSSADADAAVDQAGAENYVLGPEDKLNIKILDLDVINDKDVFRVDASGDINLPLVGRIHVSGLTVEQVQEQIKARLDHVLQDPQVTVTVMELRPQPVSVLGAVRTPGVVQVLGRKSLYEVLSLAGGLTPDAGETITITREKEMGPLPLPNAVEDPTGRYQTAVLNIRSVMQAKDLQENIQILPHDVILVKRAALVYVMGAVHKPGGFVLSEREKISVLQVLALAEGLDHVAAVGNAKIIRGVGDGEKRIEIPVNLKRLLAGKGDDMSMLANDILFVPTSASKNIAVKGLESAIAIGTGVAIYAGH